MALSFESLISNRKSHVRLLESHSLNQLNYIPEGFNNNMFWNIAHSAATLQLLVYSLSNSQWRISKEIVKGFRNGTRPERPYTQKEVDAVKEILISSAVQCQKDYEEGYFGEYNAFKIGNRIELKTVEDAIDFNLYHEGIHMGCLQAMKRLVAHVD